MPRQWYGNAQSAKSAPRSHNGVRTLNAVGGASHEVRAIYGSTDRAKEDHSNDPLCRVASHKQAKRLHDGTGQYNGPAYGANVYRYAAPSVTDGTPITAPEPALDDVDFLVKRALARGMTLVAYCHMIGLPVA